MNLLATANQNTLVNLFNPYVNEPNGVLKGHSRVVLGNFPLSSKFEQFNAKVRTALKLLHKFPASSTNALETTKNWSCS